jgi:signal transduction histidine kinase
VREIVDESAVHFWYFLAEKSMKILNQVDDSLTFSMVPLHLEIIVRNLLENAMKYSNQGGVISISAMSDIGTNIFTISDTGTGILPEDKVHIFDEFYLADTSRHKRDSHGLGLSMVKRIVSLYNGSIHVQSPGRDMGTTIIIRLPKKGL